MFNAHLFPHFQSPDALNDESETRQLSTVQQRTARLSLWRDSLIKDKDIAEMFAGKGSAWSKKHGMKKLSYLPTRLSKINEIEALFTDGNGQTNIVVPTRFQMKDAKHKKFFYLIPRNVTITYGPYFYLGILDYRVERLHGLRTALKLAGANTHLRPDQHIDHVSVWYLEKEIFACKLTDLHHGGDGELDRLCYDAAMAFTKISHKVMLNVRHKYRFDKKKLAICPCHAGHQSNRSASEYDDWGDDDDDDEAAAFVEDGNEEHNKSNFKDDDEYAVQLSAKRSNDLQRSSHAEYSALRRITLPQSQRIKFKPRKSKTEVTFKPKSSSQEKSVVELPVPAESEGKGSLARPSGEGIPLPTEGPTRTDGSTYLLLRGNHPVFS